jgi:hypothetical protein
VLVVALAACGSKGPPPEPPKPPEPKPEVKPPPPPAETEEDREKKRKDAALAIIPDGSTCLPLSLKDANAPRLELAAIGAEAVVCAMDTERLRLLGPIGCWKVDLGNGNLGATQPSPLPGRGFDVKLDDRCARGYCLPKDAKLPGEKVAHIAYNLDSTKAAVLIGDEVHIYDAKTKEHASSFSIRGDKGVTNDPTEVHWVGDAIFVEGADSGSPFSAVWVFKTDGTQVGPIEPLGGAKDAKPISTNGGSFNILDEHRVGLAELGFTTLTEYDIATAKRTKLVRTIKKGPCKKDEEENFWKDNVDALSPKCKDYMTKTYAHLVGATGISGKTNLLILLRGPRLGELAVLDAHTLAEKKTIKMTWCQAADAAPSASAP